MKPTTLQRCTLLRVTGLCCGCCCQFVWDGCDDAGDSAALASCMWQCAALIKRITKITSNRFWNLKIEPITDNSCFVLLLRWTHFYIFFLSMIHKLYYFLLSPMTSAAKTVPPENLSDRIYSNDPYRSTLTLRLNLLISSFVNLWSP